MDIFYDVMQASDSISNFNEFINRQLELDPQFLQRAFWRDGQQFSVLNYLIQQHEVEHKNLSEFIKCLIEKGADLYLHQPLHLILKLRKTDLLPIILTELRLSNPTSRVEVSSERRSNLSPNKALNSYDSEGQTLLSRAIDLGDAHLFPRIFELNLDINQASTAVIEGDKQAFLQPFQRAIVVNFPEAVSQLISAGASLHNPCLEAKEPPLLLAAHLGKIDALKVLLTHPQSESIIAKQLTNKNANDCTAIDLLCKRLQENIEPQQAIKGIAMLLCHGASAPAAELFRTLLNIHKAELVKAVKEYTKEGHSSLKFLRASHDKNNALHEIIYAGQTWSQSVRRFFGIADHLAFKCEKLMLSEVNRNQADQDEQLFATFIKRYQASIKGFTIYSPWSEMLWKITTGHINTWEDVCQYARDYPKTRTARIVEEMTKPQPEVYLNLNDRDENVKDLQPVVPSALS